MKDEVKTELSDRHVEVGAESNKLASLRLHPSSFRVVLWDIDGTLLRTNVPGRFTEYMAPAFESVFGTIGRLHEMTVSGMTDLQITCEALREHGHTHETIRPRLDELRTRFMAEMERVTNTDEPFFYELPGVRRVLEALERHPRFLSTLLTGNFEPAAKLKLQLVGLSDFFRLPGAFGDDSHDRRELPAIVHKRLEESLNIKLDPKQLIVIGDTPNDIRCAQHFGTRVIAVGTGRSNTVDELKTYNPDVVLNDLTDTDLVIRTLESL